MTLDIHTSAAKAWQAPHDGELSTEEKVGPARILVVEDDHTAAHMTVDYLDAHGMRATAAAGRQQMTSHFVKSEPDLVILDRFLRQTYALALLRDIRSRPDVPVIIPGDRRDEVDRVVGLELGADDYVSEPFSPRELLARVRAVLRRRAAARAAARRDPERGH